jgi:transposase InsO family protein
MKYEAILRHSPVHTVEKMCKALGLKPTAYWQWKARRRRRAERDEAYRELTARVRKVFEDNQKVYGYRKMWEALSKQGLEISEYKVRRIMREAGLYPITTRRFRPGHSGKAEGRFFDNVLDQRFHANRPDEVWAGDITYIRTKIGWTYLAVVIDLFNREVVGYAVSKSIDVDLVKRALSSAIAKRGVTDTPTVFHSDRGIQYASKSFMRMLEEHGIVGSMSKSGCPFDNAVAESFFSSAKRECIHHKDYKDFEEVKQDVFSYIELFYNRKRMHSTLGYKTPVEYRLSYLESQAA